MRSVCEKFLLENILESIEYLIQRHVKLLGTLIIKEL